MKIWNVIRTYGTLALLVVSCHVHANIIVEKLSRATASDVIFDSLNSRQWLGWDVTKGLTYARTLALTQVGEQFAGYSIAHNSDAQAFVNAMSPSNACGLYGYSKCIDTENQYRQQLVGETYTQYSPINRFDVDIVLFLGNTEEGERVGFIRVNTYDIGTDPVYKNTNWLSIPEADSVSSASRPIGWLLYRDIPTDVPEPTSLALLGLALAGLGATRRKKAV